MKATIDQARSVKTKAGDLARENNASVVGIGLTRDGDSYAVKINLGAPLANDLPREIDGVRILYDVTGPLSKR